MSSEREPNETGVVPALKVLLRDKKENPKFWWKHQKFYKEWKHCSSSVQWLCNIHTAAGDEEIWARVVGLVNMHILGRVSYSEDLCIRSGYIVNLEALEAMIRLLEMRPEATVTKERIGQFMLVDRICGNCPFWEGPEEGSGQCGRQINADREAAMTCSFTIGRDPLQLLKGNK